MRYNQRIKRERRTPPKTRRDDEILRIGRQMSNVFFNLAQRGDGVSPIYLLPREYAQFKPLQEQWDVATREYRASFKRGVTPKEDTER